MDFYVGKFKAERGSFITLAKGNRSKAVTQVHMHAYIHTYILILHTYLHYIQYSTYRQSNSPYINIFQYRHARLIKDTTSDPSEVRTIVCTNNANTYNIYHHIHAYIHTCIYTYIHINLEIYIHR